MNREQAVEKVRSVLKSKFLSAPGEETVAALEALGLLKFEEPSRAEVNGPLAEAWKRVWLDQAQANPARARTHYVQMDNSQGVVVRESALIDALQAAGYEVKRK